MNNLDKQYTALLQDILNNGVTKQDRTGTGTLSVFGRQIRHKMSEGFPLLTTKKMYWKCVVTELIWFLKGSTDIRFLWKNNCSIWDGDWYKKYKTTCSESYTLEEVKQMVKDGNHKFHDSMFDLGPVYGKQWRNWDTGWFEMDKDNRKYNVKSIDQIQNLIRDLKTNPDSRRLMVSAWNVAELDSMTLPPCHYGFQVYTRELSRLERIQLGLNVGWKPKDHIENFEHDDLEGLNIPTRAISLMWNQRSVDTFLGLPFNIASYGLLLEIIATAVNMVPDELIGNLGDTHLYLNHVEQAKEQIGRELSESERYVMFEDRGYEFRMNDWTREEQYDKAGIPKRTREPYPLPKLIIDQFDETNHYIGDMDDVSEYNVEQFKLENYQSHPSIKAPLSN